MHQHACSINVSISVWSQDDREKERERERGRKKERKKGEKQRESNASSPPALQLLASGATRIHPLAQGLVPLDVVALPFPDLLSPKEVSAPPEVKICQCTTCYLQTLSWVQSAKNPNRGALHLKRLHDAVPLSDHLQLLCTLSSPRRLPSSNKRFNREWSQDLDGSGTLGTWVLECFAYSNAQGKSHFRHQVTYCSRAILNSTELQ